MPTYVVLYKWTEQGIKNVKDSPARAQASIKTTEAAGGKVLGLWYTMGKYDMVAVVEVPSEELATAGLLAQAGQGFVRTTTLKAHTPAEFAEIVKLIP
ncbi:MAG: GYD domain-containing protein [Acidobacteria bacterium]|nr:GYD domain-containing protein [Acidobacteriota bacterium]